MTYGKSWIDDIIDNLPSEKWQHAAQHIKERNEHMWQIRQKLMHKIEIKMAQEQYEI